MITLSDKNKKILLLMCFIAVMFNLSRGGKIVFISGDVQNLNVAEAKIDSLETELNDAQFALVIEQMDNMDAIALTKAMPVFEPPVAALTLGRGVIPFVFDTTVIDSAYMNDTDGTAVAK
jgi:hypothetical protein